MRDPIDALLHVSHTLSLDYLKASQLWLLDLYQQHGLLIVAAYMGIYILATALSLPGALVLTLAGGALFGRWVGLVAVSFASTIGATLAFLLARYLLRDWIEKKFSERIRPINDGIQRDGAYYLFSLRLVPIIPFFLINLAMGLTSMRARTFFWVSQLGMLPATIVYVNAGTELGKITSLKGILSPGLIGSFVLVGLLPIVVKRLLALKK